MAEYEWRSVIEWPTGAQGIQRDTTEARARKLHAKYQQYDWARTQGATVRLQRRPVGQWEDVEVTTLP